MESVGWSKLLIENDDRLDDMLLTKRIITFIYDVVIRDYDKKLPLTDETKTELATYQCLSRCFVNGINDFLLLAIDSLLTDQNLEISEQNLTKISELDRIVIDMFNVKLNIYSISIVCGFDILKNINIFDFKIETESETLSKSININKTSKWLTFLQYIFIKAMEAYSTSLCLQFPLKHNIIQAAEILMVKYKFKERVEYELRIMIDEICVLHDCVYNGKTYPTLNPDFILSTLGDDLLIRETEEQDTKVNRLDITPFEVTDESGETSEKNTDEIGDIIPFSIADDFFDEPTLPTFNSIFS